MGYVRLLRRRRVLVLWGAQALSVLGDRLYAMAVMWVAWQESGAAAMGLVAVAESLPYIVLGTVGRAAVARCASLRALAVLDVVRALLVVLLPLAWAGWGVPGLLAAALLLGAAGALFDPNLGALVPDLVRPGEVQAVVGLMDLSGRLARIAGPGAAGVLLAVVSQPALFWADGATFAVSAVALALLGRRRTGPAARKTAAAAEAERVSAWQLLRAHPPTAAAIAVHGIGIGAGAVAMAMPALLADTVGGGPGAYGAVLAATGAGALAANGVAGNVRVKGSAPVRYCAAWGACGLLLAATAAALSLPYLLIVAALTGAVAPFLQITLATHLAAHPAPERLRLMTVDLTVIRTSGTVAMLVVPALAAADPRAGFVAGGLVTAVAAAAGAAATWGWARSRASRPQEAVRELAR
ncbi:MFS transporter [Streptomyces rimosus]|uniref:MFS transporter n=1 Tax=Streptomyces rimosus TaxID=1927 RepID=UPI0004C61E9E|nr:MFS transporter [Streptomyces rimosus]